MGLAAGAAGVAALGVGGLLAADAIADHEYVEGYQDGLADGGDLGGGDFGDF